MKIKLAFVLLLSIISFKAGSQTLLATDTINSITIVRATVSNFKNMIQMSPEDWESKLTNLGYGSKSITIVNTTGINVNLSKTATNGNIHSVIKNPSMITMDWYGPNDSGDIFKKLVDELRPHYVGLANGSPTYQIKEDGYTYQYTIVKFESGITVMMKRI